MKKKKIRGHKRRWKAIDKWLAANKHLDVDYLKKHQRTYVKLRIHPWSGISLINSKKSEPTGQTKSKMLAGLIEIYDAWKLKLDQLDQNYYLKIWLFEPRFSNSQVVVAIGDYLNFYDDTFFKPNVSKSLVIESYGPLQSEVMQFNWENGYDEDFFDNTIADHYASVTDYEAAKKWLNKTLQKPHRVINFSESETNPVESYAVKAGEVWIGDK